ncbi:MAG TPA: hypothetical protein PL167_00965 [Cyclobacteriaceae bacterium]|nr:hypothetical protein [Cyclobacteriaceae bacterium]
MSVSKNIKNGIIFITLVATLVVAGIIAYDILFSKPLIMEGIIVDKIYIPSKTAAGPHVLPYGKYKSYDYTITSEKHEQWIAFVKTADGNVLKVNCHSDHYEIKQIGDTLHFKEYTGELMHIDYFSHNEEDEEREQGI